MTDTDAAQEMPPLTVNGQYIKDLSFEVPGAPAIFGEMNVSPEIPIHVDVDVNPLSEAVFEVVLHLKIDAHIEGRPVFIVELAYAGVFTLNVAAEYVHPMLLVECPRLLFPFARTIVADMTRDGGFPPLMIQPIDFAQLYQSRIEGGEGDVAGHA
jgi:preprotein translocase subunit SecB